MAMLQQTHGEKPEDLPSFLEGYLRDSSSKDFFLPQLKENLEGKEKKEMVKYIPMLTTKL